MIELATTESATTESATLRLDWSLPRAFLLDAIDHFPAYFAAEARAVALRAESGAGPRDTAERDFTPVAREVVRRLLVDDVEHPEAFEPYRGSDVRYVRIWVSVPYDPTLPLSLKRIEASVPPVVKEESPQ